MEAALGRHFEALHLAPPEIRWVRDAEEGYLVAASAASSLWRRLRRKIWEMPAPPAPPARKTRWSVFALTRLSLRSREQVQNLPDTAEGTAPATSFSALDWHLAMSAVWEESGILADLPRLAAIYSAAFAAAWTRAEGAAWTAAKSAVRSRLSESRRHHGMAVKFFEPGPAARCAAELAAWVPAITAAAPRIRAKLEPVWLPFLEAYQAGLWMFWVVDNAIISCPRPILRTVNNRLHAEFHPAVSWPGGAQYWFWHGFQATEELIRERPQELLPHILDQLDFQLRRTVRDRQATLRRILREPDSETRRILIETYGWEQFLRDSGARVIDRDGDNELLAFRNVRIAGEPLVLLKVRCPSTATVYTLRVPPTIRRARAAVAWTFGMNEQDYRVVQES